MSPRIRVSTALHEKLCDVREGRGLRTLDQTIQSLLECPVDGLASTTTAEPELPVQVSGETMDQLECKRDTTASEDFESVIREHGSRKERRLVAGSVATGRE